MLGGEESREAHARTVNCIVPATNASPRSNWYAIFSGFMVLQIILVLFGVLIANSTKTLPAEMLKRLEAMAQVFQTVCALSVIGCIALTRARMRPEIVQTYEDLNWETAKCLAVGELAVILGLVGLAKLHLVEFLIAVGLVLIADFGFVFPAGLKLLPRLPEKK